MRRPIASLSFLAALACCGFLAGCGDSSSPAPGSAPPAGAPSPAPRPAGPSVSFAPLGSRESGGCFFMVRRFREVMELEYPGVVAAGAAISFIPTVVGPDHQGATIRVEVMSGGGEADANLSATGSPVGEFKPVILPAVAAEMEDPLALLSDRRRIALDEWTGKSVRLRFTVSNAGPDADAALYDVCFEKSFERPPPDILLICSDTHRVDYATGAKGSELMPTLAAFAESAVRYDRAWSTASWTLPSITSVHTGLFPLRHSMGERRRVITESDLDSGADRLADDEFYLGRGESLHVFRSYPSSLVTFPEILQTLGYRTSLVSANAFYYASGLMADGHDIGVNMPKGPAEELNRAARRILEASPAGHPVFMLVHYLDVHEYLADEFAVRHPGVNAWTAPPEPVRESYAAAVRRSDEGLRELLDIWKSARAGRDSMVAFYSDHGEHLFDPGYDRPPVGSNPGPETALLDHGNSMDETLLHVPLIVRYPASMNVAPAVIGEPVSLVDLFPTVLRVAGVRVDGVGEDGVLLPRTPKPAAGAPEPRRLFFADFQLYGPELASVRRGERKLVITLPDADKRLVDLTQTGPDRAERDAVVAEDAVAAELLSAREEHRKEAGSFAEDLGDRTSIDAPGLLDDMRALGYLR